MKRSSKIWWGLGVPVVFAFVAWRWTHPSFEAKRYSRVRRGDLTQTVTLAGQIKPKRRTIFVAPYTGYIQKIFVKIGQKVRAGDPVLSVVSSLQSPEPVYPIRAPFAGTVVDVPKSEGEFVTEKDSKDVMARIDDLDEFYVVAKAPELDASRVHPGLAVDIRVSALGEARLSGVVKSVDLAAQEADGWKSQQSTFDVKVLIKDPPPALRSGQSATVDVVAERIPNVLYLEHEFILEDSGHAYVLPRAGGRRAIELGAQTDTAVEVKGLNEGDEVEQIDFLKLLGRGGG